MADGVICGSEMQRRLEILTEEYCAIYPAVMIEGIFGCNQLYVVLLGSVEQIVYWLSP